MMILKNWRSVAFLSDKFLISQPGNNIIYDSNEQIKGIKLKPEIKKRLFDK